MKKPKIIEDGNQFHIYFKNVDFWLNKQELLELFAMVLPYVRNEAKNEK